DQLVGDMAEVCGIADPAAVALDYETVRAGFVMRQGDSVETQSIQRRKRLIVKPMQQMSVLRRPLAMLAVHPQQLAHTTLMAPQVNAPFDDCLQPGRAEMIAVQMRQADRADLSELNARNRQPRQDRPRPKARI